MKLTLVIRAFFISVILIFSLFAKGQTLSFSADIGYGNYSMSGLKSFNNDILNTLPVEARLTDDFPAQPFFYGSIIYQTQSPVYVGASCGYYTTGSRISYKDYSGELRIDNLVSAWAPGIIPGIVIMNKKLTLKGEANISYSISKLRVEQEILNESEELKLEASSLQLEPRIKLAYPLKSFEFGFRSGYLIDFGNEYNMADIKEAITVNRNDKGIKSNWSGFRLAAFISYSFKIKEL